jgi:hypothetical protein
MASIGSINNASVVEPSWAVALFVRGLIRNETETLHCCLRCILQSQSGFYFPMKFLLLSELLTFLVNFQ